MELITKEMQKMYTEEQTNDDGSIRRDKFQKLEDRITNVYKKLSKNEQTRAVKVAGSLPVFGQGRVQALKAFHMQQQSAPVEAAQLAAELIRLRQWLVRQGAHLTVDGKVIWRKSGAKILWDTELQQFATKVAVRGSRLYAASGKPLDTRLMATHFSGPGYAIYVMSKEGNLHVTSHSAGQRHHSSLLGGMPVAGAGELRVDNGMLREISNKSGHYQPEPFYLVQVLKQLIGYGLPDVGYQVVVNDGQVYGSAKAFLAAQDCPVITTDIVDTGY